MKNLIYFRRISVIHYFHTCYRDRIESDHYGKKLFGRQYH